MVKEIVCMMIAVCTYSLRNSMFNVRKGVIAFFDLIKNIVYTGRRTLSVDSTRCPDLLDFWRFLRG